MEITTAKNGALFYSYKVSTYTYGYSGKPKVSLMTCHLNGDVLVVEYAKMVVLERDRYAKKKQADCELIAEGNFPAYIQEGRIYVADGFELEDLLSGVRCASGYGAKDVFKGMGWRFDWDEKVWVNPNFVAAKIEIPAPVETEKTVTIAENGIAQVVNLDSGEIVAEYVVSTGETVETPKPAPPEISDEIFQQLLNMLEFRMQHPKDRCVGVVAGKVWNLYKIERCIPHKWWYIDKDKNFARFDDASDFWDATENMDAHGVSYIESSPGMTRITRFVKN
jgi:hypothetical protein